MNPLCKRKPSPQQFKILVGGKRRERRRVRREKKREKREERKKGGVDLSLFGVFCFGGGGIDNFCCGCDRNEREI